MGSPDAYIGHPRLESLIALNKITAKDFLTGPQEAEAFENREFVKLHQSTLRKVDTLANIFHRTMDGSLTTRATWIDRHGLSPTAIGEWLREHWLVAAVLAGGGLLTFIVRVYDLWAIFGGKGV